MPEYKIGYVVAYLQGLTVDEDKVVIPFEQCLKKWGLDSVTRLSLLTVLLSIKALLESNNVDKALELINEVIAEAKQKDKQQ